MITKIPPVKFSDKALEEIKNIRMHKKIPDDYHLRVGIKGGGCAGISYLLGFDKPGDQDECYEYDGINILVDKKHLMYLIGKIIDYHQGPDDVGFVFLPGSE